MNDLLEFAKTQLGQKEIAGDNNNQTILNYAKESGFDWVNDDETPWCFSGDVQILTSDGFVRFDSLSESKISSIAMVDEDQKVLFTDKYALITKYHTGTAKHIKSNNIDVICDVNHEFYGRCDGSSKYKKKKISKITKSGIGIPYILTSNNGHGISDINLKLLAAFISDGRRQHKRIYIGVKKKRKVDDLLTYKYIYRKDQKNKKMGTFDLFCFYYPIEFDDYISEDKVLKWSFISKLSSRQCKLFISTFMVYDGNGKNELYTSLKGNQDALNYIATMGGIKSTPYSTKQVSKNTKIEYLHNVYISKNKLRYILPSHVSDIEYNENLYCASVPTGKIIIKDKNGTIIQTGNCSIFVNWVCMKMSYERTKKANARSWMEIGLPIQKPVYGCICVYDRGTSGWEGHVGLFDGEDDTHIYLLGGNQSNSVNIAKQSKTKLLGYRILNKIKTEGHV